MTGSLLPVAPWIKKSARIHPLILSPASWSIRYFVLHRRHPPCCVDRDLVVCCLQEKLERVLDDLLELADPFATNSAVDNLVVEAGGDGDLVLPLNALGAVLVDCGDSNLLGGANGEDGSLGRVDNGGEVVDGVVHAHVGDGDGAALVLLGLELVVTGLLGELLDLAGDGREAAALNASDNGGDEASGGGNGNGDVDRGELADRVIAPAGVDGRDLLGGNGNGLDQEVVDRELVLALGGGVESLAELKELADRQCAGDEEVGVLLGRLEETVGNDLAHASQGNVLVGSSGRGARGGRSGNGLLDIFLGDLATLARALDGGKVDVVLAGKANGSGESVGLTVKRSLEGTAGRSVLLGLGGGGGGSGSGLGSLCGFGGLDGGTVATSILNGEVGEGGNVGAFLDKNGNGLLGNIG